MELKQLRSFLAAAERGGIGRGAETLYVSRSSVSRDIAALEAELGVRLLARDRRSPELTPAGRVLLEEARRVLAAAEAAAEKTKAAGHQEL